MNWHIRFLSIAGKAKILKTLGRNERELMKCQVIQPGIIVTILRCSARELLTLHDFDHLGTNKVFNCFFSNLTQLLFYSVLYYKGAFYMSVQCETKEI